MELVETVGRAGAGALPVTDVPSVAVAVAMDAGADDAEGSPRRLRAGEPA